MTYTYEDFTSYYGGTSPKMLREYAENEIEPRRKQMFLKLAQELESGVRYEPGGGGQLWYQRV